jgi:hypothetical protein
LPPTSNVNDDEVQGGVQVQVQVKVQVKVQVQVQVQVKVNANWLKLARPDPRG